MYGRGLGPHLIFFCDLTKKFKNNVVLGSQDSEIFWGNSLKKSRNSDFNFMILRKKSFLNSEKHSES